MEERHFLTILSVLAKEINMLQYQVESFEKGNDNLRKEYEMLRQDATQLRATSFTGDKLARHIDRIVEEVRSNE